MRLRNADAPALGCGLHQSGCDARNPTGSATAPHPNLRKHGGVRAVCPASLALESPSSRWRNPRRLVLPGRPLQLLAYLAARRRRLVAFGSDHGHAAGGGGDVAGGWHLVVASPARYPGLPWRVTSRGYTSLGCAR